VWYDTWLSNGENLVPGLPIYNLRICSSGLRKYLGGNPRKGRKSRAKSEQGNSSETSLSSLSLRTSHVSPIWMQTNEDEIFSHRRLKTYLLSIFEVIKRRSNRGGEAHLPAPRSEPVQCCQAPLSRSPAAARWGLQRLQREWCSPTLSTEISDTLKYQKRKTKY
jgi:hypothetical protein